MQHKYRFVVFGSDGQTSFAVDIQIVLVAFPIVYKRKWSTLLQNRWFSVLKTEHGFIKTINAIITTYVRIKCIFSSLAHQSRKEKLADFQYVFFVSEIKHLSKTICVSKSLYLRKIVDFSKTKRGLLK